MCCCRFLQELTLVIEKSDIYSRVVNAFFKLSSYLHDAYCDRFINPVLHELRLRLHRQEKIKLSEMIHNGIRITQIFFIIFNCCFLFFEDIKTLGVWVNIPDVLCN